FFSTAPPTTSPYTLSLHDALPICRHNNRVDIFSLQQFAVVVIPLHGLVYFFCVFSSSQFNEMAKLFPIDVAGGDHQRLLAGTELDRKSTRLNSSHVKISYAVFCLK